MHSKTVAAAVGGTLAALAVVAAIVLVLLYYRRRDRSLIPRVHPSLMDPTVPPPPTTSYDMSSTSLLQGGSHSIKQPTKSGSSVLSTHTSPETGISTMALPATVTSPAPTNISPMVMPSPRSRPWTTAPAAHTRNQSDPTPPAAPSGDPIATGTEATIEATSTRAQRPMSGVTGAPTASLTEPQIDTIHRLLKQNVPAPIVATVMESMLSGEGPSSGGDRSVRTSEAPPGYDLQ